MSSTFVGQAGTGTWPVVPFGLKTADEVWLERADHPLMNDLILKLLFEHVRRFDLKACRGVCKKWNQYTLPHMRSTYQVTIHGNYKERSAESRRIVDFVELLNSNVLGIPFAKYRLGPFDTTDGAGKQFLEICGEFIKEIVLFQPKNVYCAQTIESISAILKFSSKLESFSLSGEFISRSGIVVKLFPDSPPVLSTLKKLVLIRALFNEKPCKFPVEFCPTFFDELLGVAGNISDITVEDTGSGSRGREKQESRVVSSVLSSMERLGIESSIQSLSFTSLRREHIEILKRLAEKPIGLKLRKLSLKLKFNHNAGGNADVQIKLATIFKDTLEEFNIICANLTNQLMEFPEMPKLKSFNLGLMGGHRAVNLNQIFPVIETLNMGFQFNFDNSEPLEPYSEFQICPTVKTLIVNEKPRGIRPFLNILRIFPNLGSLKLSVEGKDTGQVVRHILGMTQLESLSLDAYIEPENAIELDSLFTGIPIQGLNSIRQVIPDLEKMTMEERRASILNLWKEHKTQGPSNSIRKLTNLRHLKLWVRVGLTPVRGLTDLTGYLAIYLMKRLNHLDIERCEFTKTCCEILTRETGLETWSFKTDKTVHIIPHFQTN